jgi:hypothetical protein
MLLQPFQPTPEILLKNSIHSVAMQHPLIFLEKHSEISDTFL